jgi:hypothetical protein
MRLSNLLPLLAVTSLLLAGCSRDAPLVERIPPGGLVAFYEFDGTLEEASGSGLDGTSPEITYVRDRFGQRQGAVYFDGRDDYVDLGTDQRFKSELPLSFAFWMRPDDVTSVRPPLTTSYDLDVNTGIFASLTSDGGK